MVHIATKDTTSFGDVPNYLPVRRRRRIWLSVFPKKKPVSLLFNETG
jgi:hypothetical protein